MFLWKCGFKYVSINLERFYTKKKNNVFLKFLHSFLRMPTKIEIIPAENTDQHAYKIGWMMHKVWLQSLQVVKS